MSTIEIRHAHEPPELTSGLSHKAWQSAQWNSGFTIVDRPELKATDTTAFTMMHDAEKLYMAFKTEVMSLAGQPLYYEKEDPKGEIQVMIDSEGQGQRAGLFFLFGNGNCQAQIVDSAGNCETWPGTIEYFSETQGTTWIVEIAVPLAQFNYAVSRNNQWNVNVVRLPSRNAVQLWSSFAPLKEVGGAFFLPQYVKQAAKFEAPELLSPFLWSVTRAGRGRMVATPTGLACRQSIKIINLADVKQSVELHCSVGTGKLTVASLEFDPNETRLEIVEAPVSPDFYYDQFSVTLVARGSSKILSRSSFLVEAEPLSWKEHFVRRRNGDAGCTCRAAQMQFTPRFSDRMVIPFGLALMDNGEIIMAGAASGLPELAVAALSSDNGATWSEYQVIGQHKGNQQYASSFRPMMLTYLGRGSLCLIQGDTGGKRLFSHDYGRTWAEAVEVPPAPDGYPWAVEGNALVDRDEKGNAIRIAETGQTHADGSFPVNPACLWIRWSQDGGRTWGNASRPEAWRWQETYKGKTWNCSGYEGALVRAANGWIVAALRMSVSPKLYDHPFLGDNLMGTGVSISRDDGKTWSPIKRIFDAGRMHANLVLLSNGDLVMTVICRVDIRNGKLASYRRGCEAVISHDNGLTWDVEHRYTLDDLSYCEGERWMPCVCGHLYSIALKDDSILTGFGNFLSGGELIKWKP